MTPRQHRRRTDMAELWSIFGSLALCGTGYAAAQRLAMRLAPQGGFPGGHAPPPAGDAAAAITGIQVCCFFLAVTARPMLAAALALAILLLLMVFNRVKEQVLREPLVLADACLLPQIWRYPEMYIPFLPVRRILAGTGAFAVCVAVLLHVEHPVPRSGHGFLYGLLAAGALLPGVLLWLFRRGRFPGPAAFLLRHLPVSHDAAADAARNGPLAAALMHPVLAGTVEKNKPDFLINSTRRPYASRWPENFERLLEEISAAPPEKRPHVTLIQAESFCDIREYLGGEWKEALQDFLPNWDRLKTMGRTLPTPENAYGAYTMRTEFSMLTGLRAEALGPFAFNPYLLAARQPMWSLARFFRAKGYATVCMHPYHKGFFRRDKVMPNLGFERFLGIEELAGLEKFGPYTSDNALGDAILAELARSQRPVFCFAITMEAHGPWLEGRLGSEELTACSLGNLNKGLSTELSLYCRHIRNSDTMLGRLHDKQKEANTNTVIVYGDHIPSFIQTIYDCTNIIS